MVDDLVTGRILAKQDQTILLKNVNFHGWNVDLTEPDEPDENDVVDFEIDDVDDATAAAQDPIEENLFNDLLDVTSELVVNCKRVITSFLYASTSNRFSNFKML